MKSDAERLAQCLLCAQLKSCSYGDEIEGEDGMCQAFKLLPDKQEEHNGTTDVCKAQ